MALNTVTLQVCQALARNEGSDLVGYVSFDELTKAAPTLSLTEIDHALTELMSAGRVECYAGRFYALTAVGVGVLVMAVHDAVPGL